MKIVFDVEGTDYLVFKQAVGFGNVSKTLRGFVKSYVKTDDVDESVVFKRFEITSAKYERIKVEYETLKMQVDAINAKHAQDEMERLEAERKEREKMNKIEHDSMMAQLSRVVQ